VTRFVGVMDALAIIVRYFKPSQTAFAAPVLTCYSLCADMPGRISTSHHFRGGFGLLDGW